MDIYLYITAGTIWEQSYCNNRHKSMNNECCVGSVKRE